MVGQRPIELQELSKHFSMPEKAVAKTLGICLTSLKKICRQHGVTRWPYRKIKSLDKKLRKLETVMSDAKDDPSMAYTYSNLRSEKTTRATVSGSPTPCSSDASLASTPRQHTPHAELSTSPERVSPVDVSRVSSAIKATPTSSAKDKTVKMELSMTQSMLQSVVNGSSNLRFVVQGLDQGTFASSLLSAPALATKLNVEVIPASCVVKAEPCDEAIACELDEVNDDDIIAMLAQCAGGSSGESSTSAHQAPSAPPSLGNELSDSEIMASLAGCCVAPASFIDEQADNSASFPAPQSADRQFFYVLQEDEDDFSFGNFTGGDCFVDLPA